MPRTFKNLHFVHLVCQAFEIRAVQAAFASSLKYQSDSINNTRPPSYTAFHHFDGQIVPLQEHITPLQRSKVPLQKVISPLH